MIPNNGYSERRSEKVRGPVGKSFRKRYRNHYSYLQNDIQERRGGMGRSISPLVHPPVRIGQVIPSTLTTLSPVSNTTTASTSDLPTIHSPTKTECNPGYFKYINMTRSSILSKSFNPSSLPHSYTPPPNSPLNNPPTPQKWQLSLVSWWH